MTPAQQAASDALGLAVLATAEARRRHEADRYDGPSFGDWQRCYRAECAARAALAALVAGEGERWLRR